MRLVRLGQVGKEFPAVILEDNSNVLDARSITTDYDPEFFANDG